MGCVDSRRVIFTRMKTFFLIATMLACTGLMALAVQPAGGLDTAWGNGGTQTLSLPNNTARVVDMAVAADGTSYSIATADNPLRNPDTRPVVVKFTPSGVLDTTFNATGYAFITNGTVTLGNPRIALQSDGKIIVACNDRGTLLVQRLNPNGQVDTTFGLASNNYFSKAYTDNQAYEVICFNLLARPNGTIVLSGYDSQINQPMIIELSASGVKNTQSNFSNGNSSFFVFKPSDLKLLGNGKLLATWVFGSFLSESTVKQARFNTDNTLDQTFGSGGIRTITTKINHFDGAVSSSDGSIWAGGINDSSPVTSFLARIKADGSLDDTFGSHGIATIATSVQLPSYGLIGRPSDGRLFIGGTSSPGLNVRRYKPDGALDAAFGDQGIVSARALPTAVSESISGLVSGADGKLYAFGSAGVSDVGQQMAWARINPGPDVPVVAPVVTDKPASVTINRTENKSYPVTFTVGVQPGNPITPWYRWKHGDKVVAITQGTTLTLADPTYLDEGDYSVEVGNDAGSTIVTGFSLTVSSPPLITQQPVGYSGPREENWYMSVNLVGRPPFTIEWTCSNPKATLPKAELQNDRNLIFTSSIFQHVNADNSGDYRVKITNAEGSVTSDAATIKALPAPPLFREQFVAPFVFSVGQPIELGFDIQGVTPVTCKWQKNGVDYGPWKKLVGDLDFPTHCLVTLDLPPVVSSSGKYRCVAKNSDGTSVSQWLEVIVVPDAFAWQDYRRVVTQEGDQLLLSAEIFGSTPITRYQWQHNGRNVVNDQYGSNGTNVFTRRFSTAADAGQYRLVLTSAKGVSVGSVANVSILRYVNPVVAATGKTATLKLDIVGSTNGLGYHWHKDLAAPLLSGRVSGVDTPILTITNCSLDDTGFYYCDITGSDNGPSRGGSQLYVESEKPELIGDPLENGKVGIYYAQTFIGTHSGTFTAEGLPAGLNNDFGFISGVPRESGDFQVRITVQNPLGSVTATYPIHIAPINPYLPGEYTILLSNNEAGTQGAVRLAVSPNGKYTGKLSLTFDSGTLYTRSFTGEAVFSFDGSAMGDPPGTIAIPALGLSQGVFHPGFSNFGDLMASTFEYTDKDGNVKSLAGYATKTFWNAATIPATAYAGYYTAELARGVPEKGVTLGSAGSGYAAFTVRNDGTLVFSGRMPDGSAFVAPGILSQTGEARPLAWMHGYRGDLVADFTIKIGATSDFHDNAVTGKATWHRPANLGEAVFSTDGSSYIATEAAYDLMGAKYLPPNMPHLTSSLFMDAAGRLPNGDLGLVGNGLMDIFSAFIYITTSRQITFAPGAFAGDAPCTLSPISYAAGTGEFFGTYTTKDNRRGILRGIATRNNTNFNISYGAGFFYDTNPPSKNLTSGRVGMAPNGSAVP